ncbi:hypothetical protein PRK78_002207 [Emydomyces testavorans]|uniref:Uncharacterized protein n=1 Tax=Emydomyces testavorans TaxID=2070801 RepID=A0AAF0IHK9_9EURO|nr:hypothetical protein PRK78_002207 [Emydomyces testavorans]
MAEEKSELIVVAEQLLKKSIKIMQNLTAIAFTENSVLCESVKTIFMVEENNEEEEKEKEDSKKQIVMCVYNCMISVIMTAVFLMSAQQAFFQILILTHQQFTAAAKASSALMTAMAAFTDLYMKKVGLEGVESIDEKIGAANSNNEKERVAGGADSVIENLVHQHE